VIVKKAHIEASTRRAVERLVTPLARTGIDPNALTVAGMLVSVVTAVCIGFGWTLAGGLLVLVTGVFDMLDGAVARVSGNGSRFGAFLDSTLDRWAEGLIFTGLVWYFVEQGARIEVVLTVTTMVGSMLISYTRARAEGLGVSCEVGAFQRPERLLVLGLALLGPAWLLSACLWLMSVATQMTAVQRILHVHGELERQKRSADNEAPAG
jgi:CDP-diacylglycerol--glycerol-3-phosphate 3-phosphatidyltransferase